MSTSNAVKFPIKWDIHNESAKILYNKCLPYVTKMDDFYKFTDISVYFNVFSILSLIFMIFANFWLFLYRKTYIFKRQCVAYYAFLLIGSLILSIDNIILKVNFI